MNAPGLAFEKAVRSPGKTRVNKATARKARRGKAPFVLGLFIAAFLIIESFVPMRRAVQIGADEGFELAKATLCVQGHHLYREVWNDQPPLHTFLVTEILKHVSASVLGPRLLTVGFSMVLLGAVFVIVRRVSGLAVAALTTGMIITSPGFIELSSSCMLEIPALAMALAAIALLLGKKRDSFTEGNEGGEFALTPTLSPRLRKHSFGGQARRGRLHRRPVGRITLWPKFLAGVLFGLGLQMKLVPIIYLPLVGLIVLLQERGRIKRAAVHIAVFGAGLIVAYIGSDLLIERGAYLTHFGQSWKSHFGAVKVSAEYGSPSQHPFDWSVLVKNWDVTVPAVIGVLMLIRRLLKAGGKGWPSAQPCFRPSVESRKSTEKPLGSRRSTFDARLGPNSEGELSSCAALIVPLVWLALTFAVFGMHKPWWAYYYLHTAIPLCWCAAISIGLLGEWIGGLLGTNGRGQSNGLMGVWIGGLLGTNSLGPSNRRIKTTLGWLTAAGVGLFALCSVGWMGARVYLQVANLRAAPKVESTPVIAQLQRFRPHVQWLYADKLVYSFHSSIPVVPSLAVMPVKRLWSGELDNAGIRRELERYKPGVMVLLNDGRDVPFKDLLDAEYQMVYMDSDNRMYALREIARKATSDDQ